VSKNFELMQKAEQDQEIFLDVKNGNGAHNGSHPARPLDRITKEETAKLVQRLFLLPGAAAPRVVVFSGIERGDGCTSICARAAETLMAMTEGSICVVDANLRHPGIHEYFQMKNRSGFSEALTNTGPIREFAQAMYGGKLLVITAGSQDGEPSALLSSPALVSRIAELRREFAYVLIDTPPANLYGDASTVGKQSDGTILVLNSNNTRRETARRSKLVFEGAGVPVLGGVLNRRTFPIPQPLYDRL
jgi:Mrp family chromosome partitioning ATPase